MTLKNTGPSLPIPTGYETTQGEIARRRRIADALTQKAMGDHAPFRSWTEVLGKLGEAFFARRADKKATGMEEDLRTQQASDYRQANDAFEMAMDQGATPDAMMKQFGDNPWLQDRLEPLKSAWADALVKRQAFGAPTKLLQDGKTVTAQMNGLGETRMMPGGFQAMPNVQNVNNNAVNMDELRGGEVLPQPADDLTIYNSKGEIIQNEPNIAARERIGMASAPRAAETKITVNNADEGMKGAMKILEGTQAAAAGAAKKLITVSGIRKAMATGKVSLGPGATAGMVLGRLFGGDPAKLGQTRAVLQGSMQLVLDNRKALEGQGAISNYESEIAQKAITDGIDSLSAPELGVMLTLTEKMARYDLSRHEDTMNRMSGIPGLAPYLEAFKVDNPLAPRAAVRPKAAPKRSTGDPVLDEIMGNR